MTPKKILFGCVPADGHFNPLTGLAMHLKSKGHDVRFYTQEIYKEKLDKMGIPFYPFVNAPQSNVFNFESFYPERAKIKSQVGKFRYDLEHIFVGNTMKCFEDIKNIHQAFPFDLFIADILMTAPPIVKEKLNVPVIAVGVIPLMETSKDLPPGGLGWHPATTLLGKVKHALMRKLTDKMIFSRPNKLFRQLMIENGIEPPPGNLFDMLYRSASVVLQSGTPGFEYSRSDMSKNIRYVGPLLPFSQRERKSYQIPNREKYKKVVLVTQGTVEKDPQKLIIPTIEAYKNSRTLVIVTTGGHNTKELRERYTQSNIIIEDYIPFNDVMPQVDVYITNGGYGGVLLGIQNKTPMVVAGVHEGKNEICARVGYFKLGIDLRTELPIPRQIFKAVEEVAKNPLYRSKVNKLAKEFQQYNSAELCEKYVNELLGESEYELTGDFKNESLGQPHREVYIMPNAYPGEAV